MKRFIIAAIIITSLMPVACKVDRGTILSLPFFSLFGGGSASPSINSFALAGVPATINGTDITVTVSCDTDLSSQAASFTFTGSRVVAGSTDQTSGVSLNNFSSSVTYTVYSSSGATNTYLVTAKNAVDSSKEFNNFSILYDSDKEAIGDIDNTNHTINVKLLYGTSTSVLSSLKAKFSITGQKVEIGGVKQYSGINTNDFNIPVTYVVYDCNGNPQDYTVTVTIAKNSAKSISAFSIGGITALIDGFNITLILHCSTNLSTLKPEFTTDGEKVTVEDVEQTSGVTVADFSSSLTKTYKVTAADGTTENYTVTITLSTDSNRNITSFSFGIAGESVTITPVDENNGTINVTVPCGTSISSLVPTFTITGKKVTIDSETGGELMSDVTSVEFDTARDFFVEACDGSYKKYTVTVTAVCSSSKDITKFTICGRDGTITESGDLENNTIHVTVPNWADKSALTPTIEVSTGATVSPSSGTSNNFSGSDVVYTVTAEDDSTKVYKVTLANSSEFLLAGTYAAGYYYNGSNTVACLWDITDPDITDPDKLRINLDSGAYDSKAVSVSLSGSTVYVAGTYNGNACYWKISDGDTTAPAPVELDTVGDDSVVDSLILNDYLYISGTYDVSGARDASYWKVDLYDPYMITRTTLTGGAGGFQAYEMTKSGSTIYVAGNSLSDSYSRTSYWTIVGNNDTQNIVYNGIPNYARTIMLYNSNIYIGGWYPYSGSNTQAWFCYFSNPPVSTPAVSVLDELPYNMAAISNSSVVSSSLNVSGSRYIVGQRPASNFPLATANACYWQITGTTTMTATGNSLSGSGISFAYGITQGGPDIYITGYHNADSSVNHSTACFWKNGDRKDLTTSSNGEAAARDVFLKE